MAKYKVLSGTHQIMRTDETKDIPLATTEVYRPGDVFETSNDYSKRIKKLRSNRLQLMPNNTPVSMSPVPQEKDGVPPEDIESESNKDANSQAVSELQEMTIAELRETAAANDIDLVGLIKRDEILKRCQEHV